MTSDRTQKQHEHGVPWWSSGWGSVLLRLQRWGSDPHWGPKIPGHASTCCSQK